MPDGSFDASGMNSLNHYAYGTIGDWLYRKVAGINLIRPGYKEILISPTLTRGLTEVEARYESMYGTVARRISCRDGNQMLYAGDIGRADVCLSARQNPQRTGGHGARFREETGGDC